MIEILHDLADPMKKHNAYGFGYTKSFRMYIINTRRALQEEALSGYQISRTLLNKDVLEEGARRVEERLQARGFTCTACH